MLASQSLANCEFACLACRDAASSRASESGSSGRMAWAFSDPEHGSGSASSGGTTTLTTPDSGRVSACLLETAQAHCPPCEVCFGQALAD